MSDIVDLKTIMEVNPQKLFVEYQIFSLALKKTIEEEGGIDNFVNKTGICKKKIISLLDSSFHNANSSDIDLLYGHIIKALPKSFIKAVENEIRTCIQSVYNDYIEGKIDREKARMRIKDVIRLCDQKRILIIYSNIKHFKEFFDEIHPPDDLLLLALHKASHDQIIK